MREIDCVHRSDTVCLQSDSLVTALSCIRSPCAVRSYHSKSFTAIRFYGFHCSAKSHRHGNRIDESIVSQVMEKNLCSAACHCPPCWNVYVRRTPTLRVCLNWLVGGTLSLRSESLENTTIRRSHMNATAFFAISQWRCLQAGKNASKFHGRGCWPPRRPERQEPNSGIFSSHFAKISGQFFCSRQRSCELISSIFASYELPTSVGASPPHLLRVYCSASS